MIRLKIILFVALLFVLFMPACSGNNSGGGNNNSNGANNNGNGGGGASGFTTFVIASRPEPPNVMDENGLKQGLWREDNGRSGSSRVLSEGTYVDGVKHGLWRTEGPTKKVVEGHYENGKKNGDWKELEGQSIFQGGYVNDKKDGMWTIRTINSGEIVRTENYRDGILHGELRRYLPSKKSLIQITQFTNGKKHGIEKRFFHSGHAAGRVDNTARDPEGILHYKRTYNNDVLHGELLEFTINTGAGVIFLRRGEYTQGIKTGHWEEDVLATRNGSQVRDISHSGSYDTSGRRHGEWISTEFGFGGEGPSPRDAIGEYDAGNRVGDWVVGWSITIIPNRRGSLTYNCDGAGSSGTKRLTAHTGDFTASESPPPSPDPRCTRTSDP